MPEQQKPPENPFKMTGVFGYAMIGFLADIHRLGQYVPFYMGTHAVNLYSFLAVFLVFPAVVLITGAPKTAAGAMLFVKLWQFLCGMCVLQWVCAKLSTAERESFDIGLPWFPPFMEGLTALSLAALAYTVCQGVGITLALAYAASRAHIALIRLRERREVQIISDGMRRAERLQQNLQRRL